MTEVQIQPATLNLLRERRNDGGYRYNKDAGFRLLGGAGNDYPRTMYDDVQEALAEERVHRAAEVRASKLEAARAGGHHDESLLDERKRTPYGWNPDQGISFDDGTDNPALELKKRGNEAFADKDYAHSIDCYRKALQKLDTLNALYSRGGRDNRSTKDKKEEADLARLRVLYTDAAASAAVRAQLYGNVSLVHMRLSAEAGAAGDEERREREAGLALEAANGGVKAHARWARNHHRRSVALRATGRYRHALEALWKAQEHAPYDRVIDEAVAAARWDVYRMSRALAEDQLYACRPLPRPGVHLGGGGAGGWEARIGDGQLMVLSAPLEGGGHGFVWVGDPKDWEWLEGPDSMGARPPGEAEFLGGAPDPGEPPAQGWGVSQRLRDQLREGGHVGAKEARLVREFQSVAVALLLRRWDWLSGDEAAFLRRSGLAAAAEMHRTDGVLAASSLGGGAGWGGLIPLLRACLHWPANEVCAAELARGGAGYAQRVGESGATARGVVYEGTRQWLEEASPSSLPSVELVTCMVKGGATLASLLNALACGVVVNPLERIEEGVYVSYTTKQPRRAPGQEQAPVWRSEPSWRCFLPAGGFEAAQAQLTQRGPAYAAVEAGNEAAVRAIMRANRAVEGPGASYDESGEGQLADGACLLHLACQMGSVGIARALIEEGGYSPDAATLSGITPLMVAAKEGHLPLVKELLLLKADHLLRAADGCSAMHDAVVQGETEVVRALKERQDEEVKANPTTPKYWDMYGCGWTPLQMAVVMARKPVVELIMKDQESHMSDKGKCNPQFVRSLSGPTGPISTMSALEAFYCAVLAFLPSVKLDAPRIRDTWECIKEFMKVQGAPKNQEVFARLQEGEWSQYFPDLDEDEGREALELPGKEAAVLELDREPFGELAEEWQLFFGQQGAGGHLDRVRAERVGAGMVS